MTILITMDSSQKMNRLDNSVPPVHRIRIKGYCVAKRSQLLHYSAMSHRGKITQSGQKGKNTGKGTDVINKS